MARDSSLYIRKAGVAHLKSGPDVAAIVGAGVYGPNPPAEPKWPFVRWGAPSTVPFRATGMDGARSAVTVHGFATGDDETLCADLAAAIAARLDGAVLTLATAYRAKATFQWTSTQIIRDSDEATGWHAIVQFDVRVSS